MRFDLSRTPHERPERHIEDEEQARVAYYDPLTGLLNRSGLLLQIDHCLESGGGLTLLRCDLRRLKELNDTLGQSIGNALLQSVARRLTEAGLPTRALGRCGGGEFALLIERCMNIAEAASEAQALIDLFRTPLSLPDDQRGPPVLAEVGVGVASTSDARDSPEQLMTKAGRALQRAKSNASSGYHVYDVTTEEEIRVRRQLNDDLRRALENGEWRLFYQPQVRLTDRGLTGVEALLRWDHPQRGVMAPADFLPVLQRHASAARVGEWLLDEACRQLRAWRRSGFRVPHVAVNLFAIQFHDSLEADIFAALERHDLEPGDLEIEITETVALDGDEEAQNLVRSLARRGVAISLDDFGTGFASLTTIKKFPGTKLKIDRSFVLDLDRSRSSEAIVRAIVSIGANLGIDVIAEGIEREWQRRKLIALDCPHGQGYLFGPPVSADLLPRRLKGRTRT